MHLLLSPCLFYVNKIRDLFKVKLYAIRFETKKREREKNRKRKVRERRERDRER